MHAHARHVYTRAQSTGKRKVRAHVSGCTHRRKHERPQTHCSCERGSTHISAASFNTDTRATLASCASPCSTSNSSTRLFFAFFFFPPAPAPAPGSLVPMPSDGHRRCISLRTRAGCQVMGPRAHARARWAAGVRASGPRGSALLYTHTHLLLAGGRAPLGPAGPCARHPPGGSRGCRAVGALRKAGSCSWCGARGATGARPACASADCTTSESSTNSPTTRPRAAGPMGWDRSSRREGVLARTRLCFLRFVFS